jgi:SAM-dependent methyltransferase
MSKGHSHMPPVTIDLDWNYAWKCARSRMSLYERRASSNGFWNIRAKCFKNADNGAQDRVRLLCETLGISKRTTIMDVGCGPGNLAVPLAQTASHVTAIDPAELMLKELHLRANRKNVTNITTINKEWDKILPNEISSHDLVVSSYALIMDDLKDALKKMHAVSQKWICLFWFAGKETFGYDVIWPRLFNKPYVAGPDHLYVLNLLNQLEIYPNVRIFEQDHVVTFDSMKAALSCWACTLCLSAEEMAATPGHTLREILSESLTPCNNGSLNMTRKVRTAMIWWPASETIRME